MLSIKYKTKLLIKSLHPLLGIILDFQSIAWVSEWGREGGSELVSFAERQCSNFSAISWREQVNFQWDDDGVRIALYEHAEFDCYCASSLKQQSADKHVVNSDAVSWLWANQPTNFIVFGLTRPGLEASTITITPPMRFQTIDKLTNFTVIHHAISAKYVYKFHTTYG